jgi:transposase
LGRSRGGFSTKLHLICDGNGMPLAVTVSPGQEHETQQVCDLMEQLLDQEQMPQRLVGDKGYSAEWIRELLDELKLQPVIARRSNEAGRGQPFDKRSYRKRSIIERCVSWLKWVRRAATRYEKLAIHYLGMLKVAILYRFSGG